MSRFRLPRWGWSLLLGAVLMVTALPAARRMARGKTGDFSHLGQAAAAMTNGADIYASGSGYYIYPPLTAFIMQPLALLSEKTAALSWLVLNVALTTLAVFIAAAEIARRWRLPEKVRGAITMIAAIALLLGIDKLRAVFALGQIDCFMLLGFALVLRWMDRRPIAAGIAAGLAANFKYLTLIFVPYFLLKRNYRAASAAMGSFVFFLFLPALEVGFSRAAGYAATALSGIGKLLGLPLTGAPAKMTDVTWDRSVSITSAVFRLTRSQAWPDGAGILLIALILAGVIVTALLISRRAGIPLFAFNAAEPVHAKRASLEWAFLIVVAMVFSPHMTARQMILLVLIFAAAVGIFLTLRDAQLRRRIVLGVVIMFAGLTLPPFGIGLNRLHWAWRDIGGISWCALILIFILISVGSRAIADAKADPSF